MKMLGKTDMVNKQATISLIFAGIECCIDKSEARTGTIYFT